MNGVCFASKAVVIFMLLLMLPLTPVSTAFTQSDVSTLVSGLNHPVGVAVDADGNVYFTEYGGSEPGVLRCLTSSGVLKTLISNLTTPTGVAVDSLGDVWFAETSLGTVKRMDADSRVIETVAEGLLGLWGLAVDESGNIYVTNKSINGTLMRISSEDRHVEVLLEGLSSPYGVAVDRQQNVYFVEFGVGSAENGTLKKLPRGANTPITILENLQNPYAVALDDEDNIYFTEKTGLLKKLPVNEEEPVLMLSGLGRVYGLDVDVNGDVYFVEFGSPMGGGDGTLKKFYTSTVAVQPTVETPDRQKEVETTVRKVMGRVGQIRELEFKQDVPVSVLTRTEYQQVYQGSLEEGFDWELSQQEYEALYILEEGTNAKNLTESFFTSAVLGFYDEEGHKIVIVTSEGVLEMDEAVFAHELEHALQDQYFPEIFGLYSNITDDSFALQALVEGDATLVEDEYSEMCERGMFNSCSINLHTSGGNVGSEAPLGFILIQYFPYLEGLNFVKELRGQAGWEAVNRAFRDPPASTEQVIHPEKYGVDVPTNVTVQDSSSGGWSILGRDELGEFAIFTMFWNKGVVPMGVKGDSYTYSSAFSDGWDGDEIVVYKKNGRYGYVWEIAWDSEYDAEEFVDGYDLMLQFMNATQLQDAWMVDSNDYVKIHREGCMVTIINAPSLAEFKEIVSTEALPTEVSRPELLSITGIPPAKVKVNTEVMLATSLVNKAPADQSMLYIVQVKDATGRVVYLSFVSGTIPGEKETKFGVPWTPKATGVYKLEIYLWKSWTDPTPMSEMTELTVEVTE